MVEQMVPRLLFGCIDLNWRKKTGKLSYWRQRPREGGFSIRTEVWGSALLKQRRQKESKDSHFYKGSSEAEIQTVRPHWSDDKRWHRPWNKVDILPRFVEHRIALTQ